MIDSPTCFTLGIAGRGIGKAMAGKRQGWWLRHAAHSRRDWRHGRTSRPPKPGITACDRRHRASRFRARRRQDQSRKPLSMFGRGSRYAYGRRRAFHARDWAVLRLLFDRRDRRHAVALFTPQATENARINSSVSRRSVWARRCSRDTAILDGYMTYASTSRSRSQRASQNRFKARPPIGEVGLFSLSRPMRWRLAA